MFENDVQEIEFNSPKELINELMRLIEANRRKIDERVRRGEIREPEPQKVVARTAEDIGKILTRERLRLLQIIRANVHNDLTFLEGIGLLELKEGRNHIKKCLLLITIRCILLFR